MYFALLPSLAKSILFQAETEVTAEKKERRTPCLGGIQSPGETRPLDAQYGSYSLSACETALRL